MLCDPCKKVARQVLGLETLSSIMLQAVTMRQTWKVTFFKLCAHTNGKAPLTSNPRGHSKWQFVLETICKFFDVWMQIGMSRRFIYFIEISMIMIPNYTVKCNIADTMIENSCLHNLSKILHKHVVFFFPE